MAGPAEDEIRTRIARKGRITFAEFMEVALYDPKLGYYTSGADADRRRDYFTSPAAHPSFGALMAVLLWRMWEALGRPGAFHAVEMGAGDGLLARDIVLYSAELPGAFGRALRYVALDRSAPRLRRDERPVAYDRLVAAGIPARGLVGCVLSNELVDAFPVHRFEVRDGRAREVFVTVEDGRLAEVLDAPSRPETARLIEGRGPALAEGRRGEVNAGIAPWLAEVAGALDSGFVLTLDYGYDSPERQAERSPRGTVQTYYRHTQGAAPYQRVGLQDITAHVDFSAIVSEGLPLGLRPVALLTQHDILTALGLEGWLRRLRTMDLPQARRQANMMAMRELVKPEGLGGFRALVQEKGTGVADLDRLAPDSDAGEACRGAEDLPVPLLRPEHLSLIEGRYPHAAASFEGLWPW